MSGQQKIRMRLQAALSMCIAVVLASCASLQTDKLVSSADDQSSRELLALEAAIVPLDTLPDRQVILDTRKKITALEASSIKDAVYEARLASWSGRLFLIEGNTAEAERRLRAAQSLLAGDVFSSILSSRLAGTPQRKLEVIETALLYSDEKGPLLIERGRVLVSLNRYQEAVASYDQAFPLLPSFYETVYRGERDAAWQLRAVEADVPVDQIAILAKESITWREALMLTQSETSLLQYLTAGKKWSAEQLHSRLLRDGVLLAGTEAVSLDALLTRSALAYYLWQLTALKRSDPAILDTYSRRILRMPAPRSPVPDVSIDDLWFDSVMGCIENEFLSLPDGRNFMPAGTVRGTDFLQMIKRIR